MKSPGVIYRQYRQLKRKILHEKLINGLKKEHCNCFYGKTLIADKDGETREIPLCCYSSIKEGYDKIALCTCPRECNAFAYIYSKDELKDKVSEEFEKLCSDLPALREKHPDIAVYQWVLDKNLTDAEKNPSVFTSILIKAISFLENLIKNIEVR